MSLNILKLLKNRTEIICNATLKDIIKDIYLENAKDKLKQNP